MAGDREQSVLFVRQLIVRGLTALVTGTMALPALATPLVLNGDYLFRGTGGVQSFASRVAVDGDTLVTSSINPDGPQIGAAWVFERRAAGPDCLPMAPNPTPWRETIRLLPDDPFFTDQFGSSVSLVGDELLVGAGLDGAVPEHGAIVSDAGLSDSSRK